jgi:predicted nucleotidyltransferase
MSHGLSERAINTLNVLFRKYSGIQKVILYGSRAMGNYRNGSDIDIVLEVDKALFSDKELARLNDDFYASDLPYFVDCSVYADLQNQDLKAHIARVGQVLYAKN